MTPLIVCVAPAFAGTVSGIVFDEGGAPVAGVAIRAADQSAHTDSDGAFSMTLPEGQATLTLTRSSRAAVTLEPVSVVEGEVTELLITLTAGAPVVIAEEPGQSGTIAEDVVLGSFSGVITDERGRPLGGARVFVRGQPVEARSDDSGRFTVQVPVGRHEISVLRSGYSTRSVPDIEATADGTTEITVALIQAGVRMDAFVVLMPRISGGTATLMAERQSTSDMVDTLSAEEMSRRGDSSAASALKRVTGLTVVGGKYVYVRGLGERYSSTLLNGSTLPSPEPERRVVPLDLFPTAMLDSVVVQKTFSPSMPAEFGGGVVRLRTRGVPDEPLLSTSLSVGYTNGMTFQQGLGGHDTGTWDWLGFGSGHRALPEAITAAAEEESIVQGSTLPNSGGYSTGELEAFGEMMPNRWGLKAVETLPDLSASLVAGRGFDVGDSRLGAVGGLTFANGWDHTTYTTTYYGLDGTDLKVVNQYDFQDTANAIRLGGIGGLTAELGENHALRTTTILTRDTESFARQYQGVNEDIGGEIRVQRLRWVERQLFVQQAAGEHTLPTLKDLSVDWRYAFSRAKRLEPDRRDLLLEPSSEGGWEMRTQGGGNNIFYSTLRDTNHDGGLELSVPFGADADAERAFGGAVMVGGGVTRRERTVDTRRFSYVLKSSGDVDLSFLNLPPEEMFSEDSISPGALQFEESTQPTDNYSARQDMESAFVALDGRLPWRMQYIGGVRREDSRQVVETFQLFNPDLVPETADLSTSDWLPALTLTQRVDRDASDHRTQLRAGYGRTVSRPDFRELSPAVFNDVVGGREVAGNPDLRRAFIDSYDLRMEWYPSSDESLSVGGFYKRFTDPIETVIVVSAVSRVSYDNAASADNVGAEVEFRKQAWRTGALSDVYLSGNATLIRSEVDLGDVGGAQTSSVRPLQGQSPYVINLQLSYESLDQPLSASLLYNVSGPRIAEVGKGGLPDTYEQPIHRVDAVAGLRLRGGWSVKVSGRNLLSQASVFTQGDEEVASTAMGWSAGLGVSWRAEPRGE